MIIIIIKKKTILNFAEQKNFNKKEKVKKIKIKKRKFLFLKKHN